MTAVMSPIRSNIVRKQQLTFAEVAPFLGITEQFSDRVIFTNAATLSDKAAIRTRWVKRGGISCSVA